MATVLERPTISHEHIPPTPLQKSKKEVHAAAVTAAHIMVTDVLRRKDRPERESIVHKEDIAVFLAGVEQHVEELQDDNIRPEVKRLEGVKHVLTDLIEKEDIPLRYKRERHPEVVFLRMVLQDDVIREIGRSLP